MRKEVLLAIDMGGTEIKCAFLNKDFSLHSKILSYPAHSEHEGFPLYRNSIKKLFDDFVLLGEKENLFFDKIGISTPGPFDFINGVSLMEHKYSYLYKKKLSEVIKEIAELDDSFSFSIEHDAASFLLGAIERYSLNNKNVMAVTLGTGLGCVSYCDGKIIRNEFGESADAIFYKEYKGTIYEDYVSGRGLVKTSKDLGLNVESGFEVFLLAEKSNLLALKAFEMFGEKLGEAIVDKINDYKIETLIVGGAMSKSNRHFVPSLLKKINQKIDIIIPDMQEDLTLMGAVSGFKNKKEMDVVKLEPNIKDFIWGGTYFKQYGKGLNFDRVSECWELSLNKGNESFIAGTDKRISEIFDPNSIGPVKDKYPFFPLLIKLIDAKENLSVQVHPTDSYALKNENQLGKTEMWHVISADKGAGLFVGFNKDYSKEEIYNSLKDGTILSKLNFFEVKPGDTFVINAGTVHAIGAGVRLIEIQENSTLTYRLYDYLRKDQNGNYRQLHIDKAIDVLNLKKYKKAEICSENLAKNGFFTVERKEIKGSLDITADGDSFKSITFLSGNGKVNDFPYKEFDTFYIPYKKTAHIKGDGVVIVSSANIK